jgi:hypothetical protein
MKKSFMAVVPRVFDRDFSRFVVRTRLQFSDLKSTLLRHVLFQSVLPKRFFFAADTKLERLYLACHQLILSLILKYDCL